MTSGDGRSTPAGEPITPDGERFAVSDDALDAMLEARAGRMAAGAADTVRSRVRADLHERRPGGILGFLPIGDRAGSMSGWAGWGVAIAAAVLVIAVLGGRPTEDPAATSSPPGSPGPSASLEAELGETVERLEGAAFALAVADGTLDGQIVLVNGSLEPGAVCAVDRCPPPYSFTGLPGIPVDWNGPVESALVSPTSTPVPGVYDWWDGPFLVRPGDGRLELLGYLAGVLHNPVSVQEALVDRRGYPNASSPFDILPVDGYLVDACSGAKQPCDGLGPLLSDTFPPASDGSGQGAVAVLEPAPSPGASGIVEGPFLVRFEQKVVTGACSRMDQCSSAGWGMNPTVIGQYRAQDIVRVDLPAVESPSSQPSPTPSSSPSPVVSEPSPRETFAEDQVSPALMAQPGAMTIAAIEEEAAGAWILVLTVARQGRPVVSGSFDLPVPAGWEPQDPAEIRISADGWVALGISAIEARDDNAILTDNATMTVDLFGNGGRSGAIPGSAPLWLPDGALLFTIQARLDGDWLEVARRIPDHGLGTPVDLVLPDAPPWPWFPGHYVVEGDGSGILATKDEDPVSMTIRWDGTMVERDAGAPPYLDLGAERWAGADGAIVVHCGFDTCPAEWRRPDGSRLPYPFLEQATAWLPDGSALLVLDDGDLKVVRDEGGDALTVRTIGSAPADGLQGDSFAITGITDWAAAIEGDDSMVTLVPLDGSAPVGPFAGTLAAVWR